MLRELLAYAKRPHITTLIFERRLVDAVQCRIVSLPHGTIDLCPATIYTERIVDQILRIEHRCDEMGFSFSLESGIARVIVIRVVSIAERRGQIPVIRDVDLVLHIADHRVTARCRFHIFSCTPAIVFFNSLSTIIG